MLMKIMPSHGDIYKTWTLDWTRDHGLDSGLTAFSFLQTEKMIVAIYVQMYSNSVQGVILDLLISTHIENIL